MMNYVFLISFGILLYVVYRLCFGTTKVKMIIGTVAFVVILLLDSTIIDIKIQKYMRLYVPIMRWIIGEIIGISIMLPIILIFATVLFEIYKQKCYEENSNK